MKSIKMVGLCLAAAFAFGAIASASALASGQPSYKLCAKAAKVGKSYTGEYTEKDCKTHASPAKTGKYELDAVTPGTKFTSKLKGSVFHADGKEVVCKKGVDTDTIVSSISDEDTITFEGCYILVGKEKVSCGSAGKVKSETLDSELYFTNRAETELGVVLEGSGGGTWVTFTCGSETITISGYVLGAVSNTSSGEAITFAVSSGKQALREATVNGLTFTLYLESGGKEATLEAVDAVKAKGLIVTA